ncbi:hypothetical protein NQ314_021278 [Rhamnusium bicolor]|uniref:DDE Tnp4 domain-containing protein n=1 Tax=Rhamnusium bicolor TaxID=1586634 RepID=A0AAV8WHW6_9CUCU|nr:hypothetical protein NQ314_021278 [Rhamnusium bicolor]
MAPSAVVRAAVKVVANEIANNVIAMLERKKNRKKRVWIRDWIRRRSTLGVSELLLKEISTEDPDSYRNFMRLSVEKFQELLKIVTPKLTKSETCMRSPISPQIKLEVTLRYLATGDSFASLQYLYRLPKHRPKLLHIIFFVPSTDEDWKDIQTGFSTQWNFPHCCGAIDGKHVQVQQPPNSGSEFYNYKGTYSIILFALVDANYCFKYIEVGANGRASDSTIFRNSTLNEAIITNAREYCPFGTLDCEDTDTEDIINGSWHSEGQALQSVRHLGINNHSQAANSLREKYADNFFGESAVPWQYKMIGL